jgi:hypothetical protein
VVLADNVVVDSGRDGVHVAEGAIATVDGGRVQGSRRAGVFAAPGSSVWVFGVVFGDNRRLAIDVAPRGPTDGEPLANGGLAAPVVRFDPAAGTFVGTTAPLAIVELHDAGPAGAPDPEPLARLAIATADAGGGFTFAAPADPAARVFAFIANGDAGAAEVTLVAVSGEMR